MSNYKETSINGSEYQRCCEIRIVNPVGKTPSISFEEQKITVIGENLIETPVDRIMLSFDPAKVVELRDPQSGDLLNTSVTFGEIYTILYSAYIQEAIARDASQA